jgi:hypothetical protein
MANVTPSHLSPLGASQFFSPRPSPPVAGFPFFGQRAQDAEARLQPAASASLSLQNQRSPRDVRSRMLS